MNILKNVVNKIAEGDKKTELASQKVQLNIMKDFENAVDSVINGNAKGYNTKQDARKIIEDAIRQYEMAQPRIDRAIKSSMQLEKSAKDLGLALPGKYEASKGRLFDEQSDNEQAIKRLKSIKADLNF
jgi:DNA-binding NarL/FixJ family response regulator